MIQNNEEEYKVWDQITDKLYDEGRFEELIEKYEDSYDKFPDHEYEMYTDVLFLHRQLNNNEKCLDQLEKCIDKGFFYGLEWKTWNSLKNGSRWNKIVETNENNRASQPPSKMEYKVYTPEGYDKNKKYPLFFLLHGNTQTMELFKGQWKPDFLLKKNYIVTYIQSSYWFTKTGFGWTVDCARDRKEIADCYSSVIRDYNINVDNVILGGFSGGAMASINVMMNNLFPIKGVMALCPDETADCTDENMRKAAQRDTKLMVLEGDESDEVPFQKELMKSAEKHGMEAIYHINKDEEHNVPENWDETVGKAVDFFLE